MKVSSTVVSLLIVLTIGWIRIETEGCPDSFVKFESSCYWIASNHQPARWPEAVRYCERMGARLVHIDSEEENKFLVKSITKRFGASDRTNNNFWTGATDMALEGGFRWINTTDVGYADWMPGQPDNFNKAENCVAISLYGDYYWNDANCLKDMKFICETNA